MSGERPSYRPEEQGCVSLVGPAFDAYGSRVLIIFSESTTFHIFVLLGTTTLVPLTESLYVPGKLCDLEHVIVDVGTGYYVKKVSQPSLPQDLHANAAQTRAEATKHYQSKIDYIRTNLESLQETITKKQDNMNYLTDVMQMKLQARVATDEKGGG